MAKKKSKKKLHKFSILLLIAVVALLAVFTVQFIKISAEKEQKEAQLSELSSVYESQTEANSNLKETIKNGVEDDLAKEYAQQEGYINPNQHVYIDATPGSKN